jgi:hypothetical protein
MGVIHIKPLFGVGSHKTKYIVDKNIDDNQLILLF